MQKLIEFNENQESPLCLPSQLEDLEHKSDYFEVPDLETKIQTHDNPHYWLQQDILQVKNYQFRFFNNITLTDDTISQIKVFTHFLLNFFRFNYQLLWEQQDQQAYIHFPQVLTETELLPYVIKTENKHLQYRDPTSFNITYFEPIHLDTDCITTHSETSDNRPYITSNISPETTPEEQTSNVVPHYPREYSIQPEQEDYVRIFQNQQPHQSNPLYPQLPQTSDTPQLKPSETATLQNTSEFSEESEQNVQNTQSLTITNDSNPIQIPTHNITSNQTNNPNQDNTSSTIQDNTSTLSTSSITQSSQTQRSPRQNYDPPSIPPQFSTQVNTHNSPQPGSSNTPHTNTVHFQTPTPPSPSEIQASTYTPARSNPVQNVQTGLNINTIHPNPTFNYTTSRQLSRPPLQPILTNSLSYNLTSTNPNPIQLSSTNNNSNNRPNSLNTFIPSQKHNTLPPTLQSSQFQIPNPPTTNIRTNPHFHNTSTTSVTNISNVTTNNTVPPSTKSPNTMSQPTFINSSTSISEPIKPFDGLNHNYTPEEHLQHIEARVTFSLGLQPTSDTEYKFWHARRMAFI